MLESGVSALVTAFNPESTLWERRRSALECAFVLGAGIAYAVFRRTLAFRPLFIVGVPLAADELIAWEHQYGRRRLADFGLRFDDIPASLAAAGTFFLPPILGLCACASWHGGVVPGHFWAAVLLYPIWASPPITTSDEISSCRASPTA